MTNKMRLHISRDGFHNENGPAIEGPDDHKEWYLNDKRLSKKDFTSIKMVVKMKAIELFTPRELMKLRNG